MSGEGTTRWPDIELILMIFPHLKFQKYTVIGFPNFKLAILWSLNRKRASVTMTVNRNHYLVMIKKLGAFPGDNSGTNDVGIYHTFVNLLGFISLTTASTPFRRFVQRWNWTLAFAASAKSSYFSSRSVAEVSSFSCCIIGNGWNNIYYTLITTHNYNL